MTLARTLIVCGLTIAASLAASPQALAHHSAAMFDRTKTVVTDATVKDWRWSNPHASLEIIAAGPDGVLRQWNIECSTINILARKGWTMKSFKSGDKINITFNPMKDGAAAGLIMSVKLPDGTVLNDHNY